jgi:ABC-2 type transport system ATP-binding protein
MADAIVTHGLTRSYGSRRGIIDVDLSVEAGEVFGFLGPNGAGKTTTIRLLLGFLRPDSGSATVMGHDAWAEAALAHRSLVYLSSESGFLGELDAARQLDYLAGLRGLEPGAWRPLAERLELDPTVQLRKLSHGNRQKVGVIHAFMGHEPLIILDEPSTGLDPLVQREFLALVAEARADGRTVFLSSHNLPEVERSCDRVGIIREGRVVQVSPVGSLLAEHWRSVNVLVDSPAQVGIFDLPNVEIVSQSARDIHLMVRGDVRPLLARIARLDLRDVSITTPDIEDVFLRYYESPEEAPASLPEHVEAAR